VPTSSFSASSSDNRTVIIALMSLALLIGLVAFSFSYSVAHEMAK
jgi:hypothetical protein